MSSRDPFDDLWNGTSLPVGGDDFDALWGDDPPKRSRLRDFGAQVGQGVVDSFGRAATGIQRIVGVGTQVAGLSRGSFGAARVGERIADEAEKDGMYWANRAEQTAPESGTGVAGRIVGNIAGEGAQYVAGGGLVRSGASWLLGRAGTAGANIAARGARVPTLLKDAAAVAPVDAIASAVGPENSTAGALGALGEKLDNETLRDVAGDVAANPVTRFGSEVATGMVGDIAIRGIGAVVGAARRNVPRAVEAGGDLVDRARSAFDEMWDRPAVPPAPSQPTAGPVTADAIAARRKPTADEVKYGRAMAQATSEEAEIAGAGSPLRQKISHHQPDLSIGAVGTGAGAFAKGRRTQALNRADAAKARMGEAPDPDVAMLVALEDDPLMLPAKLAREFGELPRMDDDALMKAADEAEDEAYRNQSSHVAVTRRAMLAGEAKRRGLMESRPGAVDTQVLGAVARGGVGATAGAALAPEGEKLEGAAAGAVAGVAGPSLVRQAMRGEAQPGFAQFYSRLERAIEGAPQDKATGAQWLGMIQKAPRGIWKAETEWTGIDSFLRENADAMLSREDVLARAKERGIGVSETVLTSKPSEDFEGARQRQQRARASLIAAATQAGGRNAEGAAADVSNGWQVEDVLRRNEVPDTPEVRAAIEEARQATIDARTMEHETARHQRTKFSTYTSPGGENYREVLLTLDSPPPKTTLPAGYRVKPLSGHPYARFTLEGPDGVGTHLLAEDADEALREAAEAFRSPRDRFDGGAFRSQHFDQPNILAHARVKDRTLPNGERVLFVEEIQSDWAQKGRREGFAQPGAREAVLAEIRGMGLDPLKQSTGSLRAAGAPGDLIRRFEDEFITGSKPSAVPDMPFKRTDDWTGLAMKRLIDEAVEGGYDRIAWATGEQQAARYDLSKQVKEIRAFPHGDGTYDLSSITPEGRNHDIANRVPAAKIADYVGKDLADKIVRGEGYAPNPNGPWRVFDGVDLKVGGEGMRGYYDEILPKWIKQYAKKMGVAIDVEPMTGASAAQRRMDEINAQVADGGTTRELEAEFNRLADEMARVDGDREWSGLRDNPSFRIPPELREIVKRDGQPLGIGATELVQAAGRTTGGGVGGSIVGAAVAPDGREREGAAAGGLLGVGMAAASLRRITKHATPTDAKHLQNPAVAKVAGTIGATGDKPPAPRTIARMLRTLRYKGFREVLPMETFLRSQLGDNSGRNVLAQARGAQGMAEEHMRSMFTPVLKAMQDAPESAKALARAERGVELHRAGKQEASHQQLSDWQDVIDEVGDDPTVRKAVDSLREYFRSLLDLKLEAGVITREQYDAITENGDAYIPSIPESVLAGVRSGMGGGKYTPNVSTGVRRIKSDTATTQDLVDPYEQAILDTIETFKRVQRQRVANMIALAVEVDPDKALPFIREVPVTRGEGGMPIKPQGKHGGSVVEAIVMGEKRYYEVTDKELYDSWAAFDVRLQSTVLDVMRGVKRVMQEGITGNPAFAVVNGIRDFVMSMTQYKIGGGVGRSLGTMAAGGAVGAGVNSDDRVAGFAAGAGIAGSTIGAKHVAEHIRRSVAAMNDILGPQLVGGVFGGVGGAVAGNEQDHPFLGFLAGAAVGAGAGRMLKNTAPGNRELYREYMRQGGGQFGFYATDLKSARAIQKQLMRDGVQASDFINPKSWWDGIQYISKAVETAPRLAKYKALRAEGEDVGESIFRARDLSLDFAVRPGSNIMKLGAETTAFFNPTIQGMDKLVRMLRDPNTSAVAVATIMAPTMALWALNHEDPAYHNRPQYERNTYWLVPKWITGGPEGEFFRVPKPFEVGFIYSSLPERMLDYALMQDPETLKFAVGDMLRQYGPASMLPIPTIFQAPAEAYGIGKDGFDTFRQRPVNPFPWKNIDATQQYDDRTSTVGVAVGDALNTSPAKVDHILRGYTGTLGSEALDLISTAARRVGIDDRAEPMGGSSPFVGRFSTRDDLTPEIENSIRRKHEIAQRRYNTAKDLYDRGRGDELESYLAKHGDEIAQFDQLAEAMKMVNDAADARRALRQAEMPAEEKRRMLVEVNNLLAEILSGKADAVAAPPDYQKNR